jgi:hypothetical protein
MESRRMATRMKGVGTGMYRSTSNDATVAKAIQEEIEDTGSWHLQSIVEKCVTGRARIRRIASGMGVLEKMRNLHLLNTEKQREMDDTFVSACKEAVAENDLDNGLGDLLSILTGMPLSLIEKMAAGETVTVEALPRTGVVYKRYYAKQPCPFPHAD